MYKYILAFGVGLVFNLVLMPRLIPYLHKLKFGQAIRQDGPQSHLVKKGTPTMGGIGFVVSAVLAMAVLNIKAFTNINFVIVLLAFLGYGLIGFIDDFIIVVKKDNEGLKPKYKLLFHMCHYYILLFCSFHFLNPFNQLL